VPRGVAGTSSFLRASVSISLLAGHPAIDAVAVVPWPDPVMGEIDVAVVTPADPAAPPVLADLRAFLSERVAAAKVPEAVRLVPELLLTPMAMVDRRALAEHEADEATRRPGGAG
jgi:acyl-CoA synthetase (AMP-forming)/AMP-acid ligase II